MLAKSKYNTIEAIISQALNDINISHKEFITILEGKDRYERMKENIRDKNGHKKTGNCKIQQYKLKKLDAKKKNFFSSYI